MTSAARRFASPAALALLLAGCGADADQSTGTRLRGRWVSTLSSEFVDFGLEQAGSRVTGRAELAPRGVRSGYHVQGIMRGDDLTLSLVPDQGGGAVSVRGTLATDTLKVFLDGGGFADRFVPMVRGR